MILPHAARQIGVWLIAFVLWVYAGLGLIFGLFMLDFFAPLGLPLILGSGFVAAGTVYAHGRRPARAGTLFIAGGVLVGGAIGIFAVLWEYESAEALVAGFLIGAIFFGWPPVLAGVSLIGWGFGGRSVTTAMPDGTVGVTYNQMLEAAAGTPPYTWSLESGSLPTGLTLASTGAITGTPSSTGPHAFTVKVTDSASQTDTETLLIVVGFPPTNAAEPA